MGLTICQMELTPKQKTFCEQFVMLGNATQAYQIAYNNQNTGTCKVNGSKFLKTPHIINEITRIRGVANKLFEKKLDKKVESEVELQTLPLAQRIDILSKIAKGDMPLLKPMVVDKVIEYIQVVPDWTDRRNAIAELNKMDGTYPANPQELIINTQQNIIVNVNYTEE